MKVTNRMGLPQAIVDAVTNDPYTRGDADISVTTLIGPARKAEIERRHSEEITEEASDRIWSLLGQAMHAVLERANRKGIAERRLSMTVEGWKISGGMDLHDEDKWLVDYKLTSAWATKLGAKDDWEKQLNVYAEILRSNGHAVKGLRIVAVIRDWSMREARDKAEYPQQPVVTFDLPLWPQETAQRYIRERVILHKAARLANDESALPLCSDAERWTKPAVFALMKQGQKKAVKLYDNEPDARSHASTSPALYVQHRPGERTRCIGYCAAAKFCSQANQTVSDETEGKEAV